MSVAQRVRGALIGSLVMVATGAAAQVTPAQPQPRDPNMPSPQNTVPEKIQENGATGGQTLSDKLERSDGVIRPPANTDPDITVRPPVADPGTTPVIPPPGTPGGDTTVTPK